MILIDTLCYRSALRQTNPTEKVAFAILTLLFCVVSRSILMALLVLAVTGILTVAVGKIPLRLYLRLLRVPLVFLLLGTVAILANISRTSLDAFAIPVGAYYITASYAGLHQGIQLILTALASVSCLYFLSLSTPMTDILDVLRKIHVPALLLELMLLIYRYIFLLLDLANAITTAQHSRRSNCSVKTARRAFSAMIGAVFIRSIRRSAMQFDAMESRCYDGTIRVLSEKHPPKVGEMLGIVGFELMLLAATLYLRMR